MPKETLTIKVAKLEEKVDRNTKAVDSLSGKISNLLGNHISTLTKEVASLKATQKILITIFTAILVAVIGLLVKL